jgi:SAM-dependent methyltransferase
MQKNLIKIKNQYCVIDQQLYDTVHTLLAPPIKENSLVDEVKTTNDLLNPDKAITQADILSKYVDLHDKKFLEIGSGLGVNLIVWTKKYQMQGFGIEPEVDEFSSSARISKNLLKINGLSQGRISCAFGEQLPFPTNTFDIVYSTNVLEHVQNPSAVLEESLRVLKPGGILQYIYPNYHSFFDGHYGVFHPPIYWKSFFPWYVKYLFGRNPSFAKSLRTELNVGWTKKTLASINTRIPHEIISFGIDTFYSRMTTINFDAWASLERVKSLIMLSKKFHLHALSARLMIAIKAWTPIILTVQKK